MGWERVVGRGYTPAERWVVRFKGGRSAFAKVGVTESTAAWLRAEHRVYTQLRGDFLPLLLGWYDDDDRPILLLEDLSEGHWPPPWDEALVRRVLRMLEGVRSTPPPSGLPALEDWRRTLTCWVHVAGDPGTFVAMGFCSTPWLDRALPILLEAEARAALAGSELLHFDVRSDNVCFAGERTLLVDWNLAAVGNPAMDVVAWMPSLMFEWGSQAERLGPKEPELAALVTGYFAHNARLPGIPEAPRVRQVQREQLTTALPWAARLLGLLPPDGPALVKGR
jgi:phosphotransferase family enzyme